MSQVRSHTRTVNGKTVTVSRYQRDGDLSPAAQRKRDAFERRVLRERQHGAHPDAYSAVPVPGQRRVLRKNGWQRAKRHGVQAARLWRRHKVRAVYHGVMAGAWAGAFAARRGARRVRQAWHRWQAGRHR